MTPDNSFIEWDYLYGRITGPYLLGPDAHNRVLHRIFYWDRDRDYKDYSIDHKIPSTAQNRYNAVNFILLSYIEVFRTPMMVQAMVIFYGAAMVYGIHLTRFRRDIYCSINTGVYMEIVRAAYSPLTKASLKQLTLLV